jgi:hypothetical protein
MAAAILASKDNKDLTSIEATELAETTARAKKTVIIDWEQCEQWAEIAKRNRKLMQSN